MLGWSRSGADLGSGRGHTARRPARALGRRTRGVGRGGITFCKGWTAVDDEWLLKDRDAAPALVGQRSRTPRRLRPRQRYLQAAGFAGRGRRRSVVTSK